MSVYDMMNDDKIVEHAVSKDEYQSYMSFELVVGDSDGSSRSVDLISCAASKMQQCPKEPVTIARDKTVSLIAIKCKQNCPPNLNDYTRNKMVVVRALTRTLHYDNEKRAMVASEPRIVELTRSSFDYLYLGQGMHSATTVSVVKVSDSDGASSHYSQIDPHN